MSVDNAILFTLAITLLSLNIGNTLATECRSETPCSCVMSNGESYDLSKLTPKDEFIQSTAVSNRTFYFHPCSDKILLLSNKTTGECASGSGISLCLFNATINQFTNLGTASESKVQLKFVDLPQIILTHKIGDVINTVTIDLVCNLKSEASSEFLEYKSGSNAPNYQMVLLSPHACKKPANLSGLSTGSVLVIIFFVFSGIYFAGGALALKLLRGATGWEMLPNHKFWFDFPALVRDGIAFTFNGCKVVSYDQI